MTRDFSVLVSLGGALLEVVQAEELVRNATSVRRIDHGVSSGGIVLWTLVEQAQPKNLRNFDVSMIRRGFNRILNKQTNNQSRSTAEASSECLQT